MFDATKPDKNSGLGSCTKHTIHCAARWERSPLAYRPLQVSAPIGLPHKSPLKKAAAAGNGRRFNAACTDFRLIKNEAAAIAGNRAGKTCSYHSESPFAAPSVHSAGLRIKRIRNMAEKRVRSIQPPGVTLALSYANE